LNWIRLAIWGKYRYNADMISIDEFQTICDEIAEGLPDVFFDELNGGILLLPEVKLHPQSIPGDPLYVMGEYHNEWELGRYIVLYYGSFRKVHGEAPYEELREEIRKTIAHEFRHHWESLSGTRDLEVEDEIELSQYLSNMDEEDR
jgi:hypothetical protein